jgi:DNA-binding NarL/FixJ family response regulator
VVLMDLQLPDIDGFGATAQIVAISRSVRVIMLTRLIGQPQTVGRTLARPLSKREFTVLARMADGKDVTNIARELSISAHTCRGHIKAVLSKLGAHSQLEAVVIAVRIGLIAINDETATAGNP